MEWFKENIGICMPLGLIEEIEEENVLTMDLICSYIEKNPPHFSSLRFTDLKGGEPRYISVTPALSKQDEGTWYYIYKNWPRLLKKLKGDENTCYLSSWIITAEDYNAHLPK